MLLTSSLSVNTRYWQYYLYCVCTDIPNILMTAQMWPVKNVQWVRPVVFWKSPIRYRQQEINFNEIKVTEVSHTTKKDLKKKMKAQIWCKYCELYLYLQEGLVLLAGILEMIRPVHLNKQLQFCYYIILTMYFIVHFFFAQKPMRIGVYKQARVKMVQFSR